MKAINLAGKNGMWKGDGVGYRSLHQWIRSRLPKRFTCKTCGRRTQLEACNISGKYLRKLSDWELLCRRCHMKKDGRLELLIKRSTTEKTTTKCKWCGKELQTTDYLMKVGQKKYCDRKCWKLSLPEKMKGSGNPNYKSL